MERISIFLMISLCLSVTLTETKSIKRETDSKDLDTEASAKFFDLGSLLGNNRYPYQNQYYGGVGRPYGGSGGYGYTGGYNPYGTTYNNPGIGYPNYAGGSVGGGFYPSTFGNSGYGTNILGGGVGGVDGGRGGYPGVIGLGGYGGYGGNGGLNSYYGYFDPGYYGSRNLGYGYYPGTNRYGFIPSGYRGYN